MHRMSVGRVYPASIGLVYNLFQLLGYHLFWNSKLSSRQGLDTVVENSISCLREVTGICDVMRFARATELRR